ncbi:ATP-dependent DNA ligase [Mesorhizobium sp. ORS 3324]|nr:ATP-dependent DNA ligase [Mesorhizobium sp. ORS 3324]
MPSKLKTYRAKREFSRTSEPAGGAAGEGGNRFVVHKHHATADHYDLRLEVGGVLKSWAVPRGPSLNPADKRLAVETEDHPIEYIDFEGVIPEGEYGGGPMIVWDTGTWAPMDDVEKSLRTGAFKFRLAGQKLNGGWMLTRLKPKPGEDENKKNWLLFKERDLASDTKLDILEARPESVKSGRRIEELVAPPKKPERLPPKPGSLKPGALPGAVKAEPPSRIEPQLATQVPKPPGGPVEDTGTLWLHEIKFDGYRTMAHVVDGEVRLITRGGLDWTKRYGDLPQAFARLPVKQAIIDGEIMVLDDKGISRFALLQDALAQGAGSKLHFYAFDLLHLDGWDLRKAPLEKRKALLAELLAGHAANSAIQFSDHVEGDGQGLYEQATELGLEGVVSKRADAAYQSGRTKSWTKIKALQKGDFVIAGYTVSDRAEGLAALGLAEFEEGELHYRGKVGTGFDRDMATDLLARLERMTAGATPPEGVPREVMREMHWVKPLLSARIHYSNLTADNALRHPVFRGLRDVGGLTTPMPVKRKRLIAESDLATIWVTNPQRRLFGKTGPTKLDIAVYYALVGDFMLPHIIGRPVSLVRCPTGRPQDCFFQRHAFTGMPPSVAVFESINSEGETKTYLSVEDAKGYLALAQFGVVEFHTWGTHRTKLDKPDQIVFDLDPGEGIAWREVVEAAIHIKGGLESLGLVPFAKTSGGKGIHITVPVTRKQNWKKLHQASSAISTFLAATAPDTFTTTMGKENRKKRIFIDFHRNARGHTSAAPYSLRARTNLPASTPVSWADLETIDAPEDLNYASLPGLLETSGDPWAEIDEFARDLPVMERS